MEKLLKILKKTIEEEGLFCFLAGGLATLTGHLEIRSVVSTSEASGSQNPPQGTKENEDRPLQRRP